MQNIGMVILNVLIVKQKVSDEKSLGLLLGSDVNGLNQNILNSFSDLHDNCNCG